MPMFVWIGFPSSLKWVWNTKSFWYDFGVRYMSWRCWELKIAIIWLLFLICILSPCTSLIDLGSTTHPVLVANEALYIYIYWFPRANVWFWWWLASWSGGIDPIYTIDFDFLGPRSSTMPLASTQRCRFCDRWCIFWFWSGFFPKKHGRRRRWLEKLEKKHSRILSRIWWQWRLV